MSIAEFLQVSLTAKLTVEKGYLFWNGSQWVVRDLSNSPSLTFYDIDHLDEALEFLKTLDVEE